MSQSVDSLQTEKTLIKFIKKTKRNQQEFLIHFLFFIFKLARLAIQQNSIN